MRPKRANIIRASKACPLETRSKRPGDADHAVVVTDLKGNKGMM